MAEFKESEHPRKKDGKFTTKGNGESKQEREKELENKFNQDDSIFAKEKKSILKSIKSYKKQIDKHQQKISNPEKFISNWDKKPEVEKRGLINFWEKEIKNFYNQIKKLEE